MDISNKILDDNKPHLPMAECDYFKWLSENKKDNIHGILTKKEYLTNRYQFIVGNDTLNDKALVILKCIENFYFDFYVKK